MSVSIRNFFYGVCPRLLKPYWERVEASEIGARLAGGAFWSLSGAVISRGLMLLSSILVARILGREIYGEYGMIRSTVNMFIVFAGFGFGLTATKYVAELRNSDPVRAGRIISISGFFAMLSGALIAVGVFVAAPWLTAETINAPHLTVELKIGAIILFLTVLNGAQTGALAGFEAFRTIAKVNLWVGFLSFPLLIGGVYWDGLRGAVWALAANVAINWVLNHLALRKEASRFRIPLTFNGCFSEWHTLWKFSLPAALSGVMVSPVMWACNTILVNQPDGYGQMGIFDAANQWRTAILFVPTMIGQIVLPMLSSLKGDDSNLKYNLMLKYNMIINGISAMLMALPIAGFAPLIMESYGEGFREGASVLVILVISSILISFNNVVGQAIASNEKMWIGFLFNAGWSISILILVMIFIKFMPGALSLSLSILISYCIHSIWQFYYLKKILIKR